MALKTTLAGWGARIRTWEWWNQNQSIFPYLSTSIPKNRGSATSTHSMGYPAFRNGIEGSRFAAGGIAGDNFVQLDNA
jgi:hypothetical protein